MQSPASADTATPPAHNEERYVGYRDADRAMPYAKYMKEHTDPAPDHVLVAAASGPVSPLEIPALRDLASDLGAVGYSAIETGYGRTKNGKVWVACLTDMPRVTPEMWDWWFTWHTVESARYKLWHPDSHLYSSLGRAGRPSRKSDPATTNPYVNTTSYVDEVIGGNLDQLAIQFKDPALIGIDTASFDGTAIYGTVGTALLPVNIGLVCHQVRRTEAGSEMRSRFYLNVPSRRGVDLRGMGRAVRRGIALPKSIRFKADFGAGLLRHCGEEMNHLAQFLPELHAEFS